MSIVVDTWRGKEVLEAANNACGAALQKGARIIAAQAIVNVRKVKVRRPGGYGRIPGYVAKQIKTGPTKAKGKPAGSIIIGFPGMHVELGVKHPKTGQKTLRVPFLRSAVNQRKYEVLRILKENLIK